MSSKHSINVAAFISLFLFSSISAGSIIGFTSSSQMSANTTIDFEGIISPYSSISAYSFQHPDLSFESSSSIEGIGGSIFPEANNGFTVNNSVLTSLYSSPAPNAPLGVFGQRFTFTNPVLSFGFDIQDGYPLGGVLQGGAPDLVYNQSFEIILRAYDASNGLIGEVAHSFQHTSNGSGAFYSDLHFAGLSSDLEYIKKGEVIYNFGSSAGYAIDNFSFSSQSAAVPIPSSLLLFLSGLIALMRFKLGS